MDSQVTTSYRVMFEDDHYRTQWGQSVKEAGEAFGILDDLKAYVAHPEHWFVERVRTIIRAERVQPSEVT